MTQPTPAREATTADDSRTVLVVGAGPVGLTAACELVRQGARVRLVDALAEPTAQSRAVVIHPRTQEHLAAMGVLDRVEAEGLAITAMELHSGREGTLRVHETTAHVDSRHRRILDLAQPETEAILAGLATGLGIPVERGTSFDGLVQDDDGVTVTLTSPAGTTQHRYGWVVGTDGGHSRVRAAVGTRIEGVFRGQHFLFADVAADTALSPDTIRMFLHPDGIGGAFPMPGGRTRLLFLVDPPEPGAEPTLGQTQRLVDERMAGQWRIGDPRWLTYFEVHHGQVPQYRHGRVLLAGDAAHIHSPAGGQGMNTGIQDAVNLAWKLALVSTGRAAPALLDTYHAERHPVGAAVVRQTNAMTNAVTASGPVAHLRDLALTVLGHVPALSGRLVSAMTETTIAYRRSPAVTGLAGGGRHASPGDHAPDVPGLTTADGAEAWIGDLLRRPGSLLLTTAGDRALLDRLRGALGSLGTVVPVVATAEGAPVDALVDPAGAVARRYGIGDAGLALVRPDGYLGYLSARADDRAVTEYLTDLLHVQRQPA
ncbi:2-polyprenyl-6-methoxyphenol hydroxylase [Geodermatophilus amargosae]|uniref:2-polyprenyl-6-methoxyphenol hydroxylase n=1 Tax=Geodermatophilus amargosae TaxID=1296565 RepID=A0A1I7C368_9ACTN|nr:FAD-dependent monooxygenase [Geodermatophilus amargosae]SFT93849.1 2-polyprenyl-6-methoxyphenol hydroxylase [Geodermatophilus amargosae]